MSQLFYYAFDSTGLPWISNTVRCFGTEGRPTDRPTPPKNDLYEYITFRGSDIKDISLCEHPKSHHHGLPQDPAILKSSCGSSPCIFQPQGGPFDSFKIPTYNQLPVSSVFNHQYAAGLGPLHGPPKRRGPSMEKAIQTVPAQTYTQQRGFDAPQDQWCDRGRPQRTRLQRAPQPRKIRLTPDVPYTQRRTCQEERDGNEKNRLPRDGNEQNRLPTRRRQGPRRRRNYRRGQPMVENLRSPLTFETDFDFDSANAQFIKEGEMNDRLTIKDGNNEGEITEELGDSPSEDHIFGPKCYYDKAKCFYDNLTFDIKSRTTWAEERKRNVETFGAPGRFPRAYRGHRGRGRAPRSIYI